MAWRSAETASNITSRAHRTPQTVPLPHSGPIRRDDDITDAERRLIEDRFGPVVHKIADENGEIRLDRLTGDEALRYLGAMGIQMGRNIA